MDYAFVASNGGHLNEARRLIELMGLDKKDYIIITNEGLHVEKDKNVYFVKDTRGLGAILGFFRMLFIMFLYCPDVMITTGAEIGVIAGYAAKVLLVEKIIYVECSARRFSYSKSYDMIRKIANVMIVQSRHLENDSNMYLGELI